MSGHRPTRAEIGSVACPTCGVEPRQPCRRDDGARRPAYHAMRVRRYRDGLFGPTPPIPTTTERRRSNAA